MHFKRLYFSNTITSHGFAYIDIGRMKFKETLFGYLHELVASLLSYRCFLLTNLVNISKTIYHKTFFVNMKISSTGYYTSSRKEVSVCTFSYIMSIITKFYIKTFVKKFIMNVLFNIVNT